MTGVTNDWDDWDELHPSNMPRRFYSIHAVFLEFAKIEEKKGRLLAGWA